MLRPTLHRRRQRPRTTAARYCDQKTFQPTADTSLRAVARPMEFSDSSDGTAYINWVLLICKMMATDIVTSGSCNFTSRVGQELPSGTEWQDQKPGCRYSATERAPTPENAAQVVVQLGWALARGTLQISAKTAVDTCGRTSHECGSGCFDDAGHAADRCRTSWNWNIVGVIISVDKYKYTNP